MSDLISRALLSGLGLASLTKDAIQKAVQDFIDQSKLSEAQGRKLLKDLQRRSAQVRNALEKRADATVHKVFENLDLPSLINDRLQGAKPARKRAAKSRPRRSARKTASR